MVVLQNGQLTAEFAPEHGMVCASLRRGDVEVLGQRGGLEKYAASGSTFGIPLLHPWANRLDRKVDSPRLRIDPETGLPIHGLMNGWPEWDVVDATADSLRARFDFGAHDELLSAFPYPHVIEVEGRLGSADLTITTRVIAAGHEPVPIAFGWHPYFNLPDRERDEILLRLPVNQAFDLDDHKLPITDSATGGMYAVNFNEPVPLGERDWDNAYAGVAPGARFGIVGGIEIEFTSGYPYAQVYSPADSSLIALEPMTAPTNALESQIGLRRVQPGDIFDAVFRVLLPSS